MKQFLPFLATFMFFIMLNPANTFAQTAVTSYNITTRNATATSNTSNGWNAAAPYPTSTTYTNFYGQRNGGAAGIERVVAGFNIGANSYTPRPRPSGNPFDNVVINRHPSIPGDTVNTLYEYSSNATTNLYIEPSYLANFEDVVNSFVCNRGSDNTFSNSPTTQANIERIDLIVNGGILCTSPTFQGFLINERNGNDNFKVAAITSLNGSNLVNGLGSLVNIVVASGHWGQVGPAFISKVMSRRTGSDPNLRPKQDIVSQTVSGVYISFSALGIANGTRIYGLAVFPNDVTAAMNLITLADVPSNTDAAANGGLDMMAGGGYFAESSVLPLTLTDFSARVKNNAAQLLWRAESQVNVSHFEIERSTGTPDRFAKIGTTPAIGFNQSYSYTDALLPAGVPVYYRLKMVDLDASFTYSSIVKATVNAQQSYQLYPTIASRGETVYLSATRAGTDAYREVMLTDAAGKTVYRTRMNQTGSTALVTGQLAAGVYTVTIKTADEATNIRLVIR
jgi:hypothetical protein